MTEEQAVDFATALEHSPGSYARLLSQARSGDPEDWKLGFVVRHLQPPVLNAFLADPETRVPISEGVAWGLGELGVPSEAIIRALFEMLENGGDYDAWWCAAEALEKLGQGDATDLKKRTLTRTPWNDLGYCLEHLSERAAAIGIVRQARFDNTESVIVPRCRDALQSDDYHVLKNAVWVLERLRINDTETIDALADLYHRALDRSDTMRPRIAEAFGEIADPRVRELLEREVGSAKYFRTRAYAALGLGRIGDQRSLPTLEHALQSETDHSVVPYLSDAIYAIQDSRRRSIQQTLRDSPWPENGMISDNSNFWYGVPQIYDAFASAEDPQNVGLNFLLSRIEVGAESVLELGMGTGRLTFHALTSRPDLQSWIAVDASPQMCDYAASKAKFALSSDTRLEILQAASHELGIVADQSMDYVVSSWAFPSKMWDQARAREELEEVYRVLKPGGRLLTLGWDEQFQDELSELWYRFVPEPDFRRETLEEWQGRRRSRLNSTRNCGLTFAVRNLRVPLVYPRVEDAAANLGFLFGQSAGKWVARHGYREFAIGVGITDDSRESILGALQNWS